MVERKETQQDTIFVPDKCAPYTILGEQLDARSPCLLQLTAAHPKKSRIDAILPGWSVTFKKPPILGASNAQPTNHTHSSNKLNQHSQSQFCTAAEDSWGHQRKQGLPQPQASIDATQAMCKAPQTRISAGQHQLVPCSTHIPQYQPPDVSDAAHCTLTLFCQHRGGCH